MPKHLTTSRVSGVMPSETGQFQKLADHPISFAQRQRRWHFYLGPGVQRGHLPHVDLTCFLSVLWGFVSENCVLSQAQPYILEGSVLPACYLGVCVLHEEIRASPEHGVCLLPESGTFTFQCVFFPSERT